MKNKDLLLEKLEELKQLSKHKLNFEEMVLIQEIKEFIQKNF